MALTDNILAFWKFDEAAASGIPPYSYSDSTGRGHTLTVNDQAPANCSIEFRLAANAGSVFGGAAGQFVDGALSKWGKWNRLLTSGEKAALAGTEGWPFSTTTTLADAVAYFLLDEASNAASYVDATGRGNSLSRSSATTSVTGPSGSDKGTSFSSSYLFKSSPGTDLKTGNSDVTIAGWFKLNSKSHGVNDQQLFWGQIDLASSPQRVGSAIYYEGGGDTVNFDYGNGVDLNHSAVAVNSAFGSPSTGTWYFVLSEYNAATGVISTSVNNGTPATFSLDVQPAPITAKINHGAKFATVAQYAPGTTSGWDTHPTIRATAPNHADLTFGNNSKTVWFWFKSDNTSATQTIAGFYDFSNNHIDWVVQLSGNVLYFIIGDSAGSFEFASTAFTDTASFHLLVCWFDQATATLHIDLDHGASTASHALTSVTPAASSYDLMIGANKNVASASQQLLGTIDEMGIATGTPSAGDLSALWNSGAGYTLNYTISPSSIASLEALGTAAAYRAGDIYPSAIASAETFGATALGQSITVSPSSIASLEAFGTAALTDPALIQTIGPSGTASAEAFGTLSVSGGTQNIVPAGIRSDEAVGFPTLTNVGAPFNQLKALIGGAPFLVKPETAQITLNLNTRGSATITIQAHGRGPCGATSSITRPVCGQDIRIIENYRNEFNGFIERITEKVIPGDVDEYEWAVSCVDLASICDRRVVQQTYPSSSARDMILSIVANYLNGEGISTVNVIGTGTVTGGTSFAYKTVAECFNAISRETGEQWWIDPNRDLHFALPGTGPAAPIAFTATDANFQDMTIDTNMSNVATDIIVRSDQNLG